MSEVEKISPSTRYYLESLDLSYNGLVGRFPSWLLYSISSKLWIRGNNLSGSFSIFQGNGSRELATLDISDNMLYGPLPEDINLIFPKLRLLNASYNMFNSTIPQSFGEMGQLQVLDLSSNELRGEVVRRNFSLYSLRWLYLDRNGFTGLFTAPLSKFPSLQFVSIAHNHLSGELSRSFPVLPRLRLLILNGNRLRGAIPMQICQMQHMELLDLSNNDFSGQIPTCLDNVTSFKDGYTADHLDLMIGIDISCNKLTGAIPIQMTELTGIHILNMSRNLLTGPIPESFITTCPATCLIICPILYLSQFSMFLLTICLAHYYQWKDNLLHLTARAT